MWGHVAQFEIAVEIDSPYIAQTSIENSIPYIGKVLYSYFLRVSTHFLLFLFLFCCVYICTVSLPCTIFYNDSIVLTILMILDYYPNVFVLNSQTGFQFYIHQLFNLKRWREISVQYVTRKYSSICIH